MPGRTVVASSSTPPLDEDRETHIYDDEGGDDDDDERSFGILVRDDGSITSTSVFLMVAPVLYASGQLLWAIVALMVAMLLAGASWASQRVPLQDRLEIQFDVMSAIDAVRDLQDWEQRIVVALDPAETNKPTESDEGTLPDQSDNDPSVVDRSRLIRRGLLTIRVGLSAMAKKYGKEQQRRRRTRQVSASRLQQRHDQSRPHGSHGNQRRHDDEDGDGDGEMELLCQEAAYVGFRTYLYLQCRTGSLSSRPQVYDAEVVALDVAMHSLSLLALVAKHGAVQERHLYQADAYGIDVPVAVMNVALEGARTLPSVDSANNHSRPGTHSREDELEREQKHAEVQRKGCLLLGALCGVGAGATAASSAAAPSACDMARLVAQEGGLQAILNALDYFRYHADVANWALWATFTLCYECPPNRRIFLELHGLPTALRAMQNCPDSVEVARHGTALLFDLMRQDADDYDYETCGGGLGEYDDGTEFRGSTTDGTVDVWKVRRAAVDAGLHPVLVRALTNFVDEADIAMMSREMLVGTNYQGKDDLAQRVFPTR